MAKKIEITKDLIGKIVRIKVLDHFQAQKTNLDHYGDIDIIELTLYGVVHNVNKNYIIILPRIVTDENGATGGVDIHYYMKKVVVDLEILVPEVS